jgi:hypothetical protein
VTPHLDTDDLLELVVDGSPIEGFHP